MKKVFILAVLLISLVVLFVSCKGTKTCPAYSQDNVEQSEPVNS